MLNNTYSNTAAKKHLTFDKESSLMIKLDIDPKIKTTKFTEVIDMPVILTVNEFTEASARVFREGFARAVNSGQKIIPIVIDSYGGSVYALMSMIGVLKSSTVPVATIVNGKACSCAAILSTFGQEGMRFADPFATILIHDVSAGSFGKVEDIKSSSREVERLNQIVYKMMAANVGKEPDYFLKLAHDNSHSDIYLSAEEAKSHNIINHIRTPSFTVKAKVDITFG